MPSPPVLYRLTATGLGGVWLALFVAAALLAPVLAPHDPYDTDLDSYGPVYAPPLGDYLLGTDDGGRDILSGVIYGARVSLVVGLAACALSLLVGSAVGLLAGYAGGRTETALMGLTDIFLVIPPLPLMIVIVALTDAGLTNQILAIGLLGWTSTARLARAQTLAVKSRTFVERARLQGVGGRRIITHYLLPGVLPVILANGVLVFSLSVLNESTLSFLGLGDPAVVSWGQMLNYASSRGALSAGAWWSLAVPGTAIAAVVLAASLVGRHLESVLNPPLPGRHLSACVSGPAAGPGPRTGGRGARESPLLAVEGLSVRFTAAGDAPRGRPPLRAVEDVSLQLGAGQILGVVGESGSGKSTLLLAMMGLLPPAATVSGRVWFDGRDLLALDERRWTAVRGRQLAIVFQAAMNSLNPVRTVGDQILEAMEGSQDLAAVLGRVGIDSARADDYPHEFSGGMRQRLLLAMALAGRPRVLLADEPTTALDVLTQVRILHLLDQLRRDLGLSVVLVSHDLTAVARICDRIAVLYGGTVVETGPAADLLASPRHPYTRGLLAAWPDPRDPGRPPTAIPGTPVRLDPPPPGCRFAERCPRVEACCREQGPRLSPVAADRWAACHLLEPDRKAG